MISTADEVAVSACEISFVISGDGENVVWKKNEKGPTVSSGLPALLKATTGTDHRLQFTNQRSETKAYRDCCVRCTE